MTAADVVIVGGGVTGCAIARAVAADLAVLVLEREGIATGGATTLAAAEVTMTLSYADWPEIATHAMDFFREFDGTGAFEFHERPRIELVSPDREGEARRRAERLFDVGFSASFLEPETVEDEHPRLSLGDFVGVVRHEDTGFLDPYTLTVELKNQAETRGALFDAGRTVIDVRVDRVPGCRDQYGFL